jgi:ribosome biogenesis GTPase
MLHREDVEMDLARLGWNYFFEAHFNEIRADGCVPARIAQEHKHRYLVYCEHGELSARVSGRMLHAADSRADLPAVGDWVAIQPRPAEGSATVIALLPRRSMLCRKVAWVRTEEQVLAANVDTAMLVTDLGLDFNPRRIERYLTLSWESGAHPVIILNKADLCLDVEKHVAEAGAVAFGVPIHVVSALEGQGLEAVRGYLRTGVTAVLLGSSGVGKSTLINALMGSEQQRVGAVRESDGRGRHVTTARQLLMFPWGGMIIDTPGLREIQLWAGEDSLGGSFEDIEELARECRYGDCRHGSEPGCAVKAAIEEGALDEGRFRSYLKLQREIRYLTARKDHRARLDQKARQKRMARFIRERYRHRENLGPPE